MVGNPCRTVTRLNTRTGCTWSDTLNGYASVYAEEDRLTSTVGRQVYELSAAELMLPN